MTLGTVFALALSISPPCDPSARANSWTASEKLETRERVRRACEAVGGSELYCEYWDAVVRRESWGGIASAVHTLGVDRDGRPEYGLGPMGLSVRWHAAKLPGAQPDPAFCLPEASFIVGHSIAVRAVEVYGADDAVEIQAIFGGGRWSHECTSSRLPAWLGKLPLVGWLLERIEGARTCRATPRLRHVRSVCSRMPRCRAKLGRDDLGELVPAAERWAWAQSMAEGF